jgi:hypothetical protein
VHFLYEKRENDGAMSTAKSSTNRKFAIAYAVLVLVPLVGLLGILKYGRNLKAPISVDGAWTLQVDAKSLSALPCGKSLAESPDQAFTISQSGEKFTLTLAGAAKAEAAGSIDGAKLSAVLSPSGAWASESGCGSGRQLTLMATVDPKANPRALAGVLSVDGCASCGPVEFRAVRQTPAAKAAH